MGRKFCTKCKTTKDVEAFNKDKSRKDGRFPWCKICHRNHTSEYRERIGPLEVNRRQAAFREKRDANESARALHLTKSVLYALKHRYGITSQTLVALANVQGNVCAICGMAPRGGKRGGLHVDHDHETDEVRGLLCSPCNIGLGNFRDNPELLSKAMLYLKMPPAKRSR